MLLQKSMKLLHLLEREDYVTFTIDVQKLEMEEQGDLMGDLLTLLGGSFTSSASLDLQKALETMCTLSTPERRLYPMVDLTVHSKFDNLTRILLEALSRDFVSLDQNLQEWMRWEMVVKADTEMMKGLYELEGESASQSAALEYRLKPWLSLCDFIKSTYCMRGSVIIGCCGSSSPLLNYLIRVDPLSPIAVADYIQPFVFSAHYASSQLADRLVHYLTRENVLQNRDYVRVVVNSLEYMSGMLRCEGISIDLPQMEKLFVALLPILNDYNMGKERTKSVIAFQSLLRSFPHTYQPLLLKRLVRVIKDRSVTVDAEAQILSYLVDLYRQGLVMKGKINEDYSSCLYEFWSVIYIKYDDCSQASMFYQSLFLLAGLQARMNHRLDLLKDVQVKVLTPLQQQLVDYLQLRKLQEKTDTDRAIDLSFLPTVEDDSLIRLDISLRVMKDTFQLIHQALIKWK